MPSSSACARSNADGALGALIVGLYGEDGGLREIGHSSGFTAKEKRALVVEITFDH